MKYVQLIGYFSNCLEENEAQCVRHALLEFVVSFPRGPPNDRWGCTAHKWHSTVNRCHFFYLILMVSFNITFTILYFLFLFFWQYERMHGWTGRRNGASGRNSQQHKPASTMPCCTRISDGWNMFPLDVLFCCKSRQWKCLLNGIQVTSASIFILLVT